MKILKNILLVLAILLIALNLLSYTTGKYNVPNGTSNALAYLIGRNSPLIVGILLLLIVFIIDRRIRINKRKEMVDSFLK
jgi:hypothetical protein